MKLIWTLIIKSWQCIWSICWIICSNLTNQSLWWGKRSQIINHELFQMKSIFCRVWDVWLGSQWLQRLSIISRFSLGSKLQMHRERILWSHQFCGEFKSTSYQKEIGEVNGWWWEIWSRLNLPIAIHTSDNIKKQSLTMHYQSWLGSCL